MTTTTAKKLLRWFRIPVDLTLSLISIPAAIVLLAYRKAGSARLPWTSRVLKTIGVFPIRRHYYEPLFEHSGLSRPLSDDRDLPGIDLNVSGQLAFVSSLECSSELIEMQLDKPVNTATGFYLDNGFFGNADADFLYQFLRKTKPFKIVEIGAGNSTKIARLALLRNSSETNITPVHTCIEPYERKWLEQLPGVTIIRRRLEDCDFDWHTELRSGDLLFVDSSHIIRPQGDVLIEYLTVFPKLASGVYIHIHDIFTPKDYLHGWVVDEVRFWNEQYLLEALLSNTSRYEVVSALNYLKHHEYELLAKACPYLTPASEPGSIYLRVR